MYDATNTENRDINNTEFSQINKGKTEARQRKRINAM